MEAKHQEEDNDDYDDDGYQCSHANEAKGGGDSKALADECGGGGDLLVVDGIDIQVRGERRVEGEAEARLSAHVPDSVCLNA